MASEINGLRAQILANAKIMLKPTDNSTNLNVGSQSTLHVGSQSTLLPASSGYYGDMDVVVFGHSNEFTAALMVGLTPAIEGDKAFTPESAMRKLLITTAELLKTYIPKVGAHQRNVHGGGVFDEDMISADIKRHELDGR